MDCILRLFVVNDILMVVLSMLACRLYLKVSWIMEDLYDVCFLCFDVHCGLDLRDRVLLISMEYKGGGDILFGGWRCGSCFCKVNELILNICNSLC